MQKTQARVLTISLISVGTLVILGIAAIVTYFLIRYPAEQYSAENGQVTVEAHTIDGLGTALETNQGYALYMFPPDQHARVTCTDKCAVSWPPLLLPQDGTVSAGPGVRADLLGTVPNPAGGKVVTYNGWPLYTFIGDADPHTAQGQALDADGGLWYVMRPDGKFVKSDGAGS